MNPSEPLLPKSDPPLREVHIARKRLTYTDEGDVKDPVLIAIHGVPGSVRDFRYLAPLLGPDARVIRVDLPGSGGSEPRLDALRSLEARARTVVELADQLHVADFGVVGHSMGAGTALVTAAMAPGRVARMALLAPMGLRPHRGLQRSARFFRLVAVGLRVPFLRDFLMARIRPVYRRQRFPRADEMSAAEFALQFESFSAADYSVVNRAVKQALPSRSLVALADDDHLVEPEIPLELAAAIPHARVLRFQEGGHIIQKTKAREIAEAIRAL